MELKLVRVRGQRSVKSRQRRNQNCNRVGRGGGQDIRGRGGSYKDWGGGQPLTTPTPPTRFSPPELLLPPDLAELQEVDEGLQQPDAEAAATAAVGAGRGGRGSGAQLRTAFFGPEGDGAVLGADDRPAGTAVLGADGGSRGPRGIRIVVDEPAKAEQLHDKRGQEHKQQREAEVGVLTLQVIGGRQPQVRGAVGEEHEQRAQHPAAVPQLVARPLAPRPRHPGPLGYLCRLPAPSCTAPGSSGRLLRPRAGRGHRSIRLRGHVGGAGGGERLPGGGGGGVRIGEDPVQAAPASSSSSSSSSSSLILQLFIPLGAAPAFPNPAWAVAGWGQTSGE